MDWMQVTNYLLTTLFPLLAFILFLRQGRKRHRSIPHLILISFFSFLGNFLWIVSLFVPIENTPVGLIVDFCVLAASFSIFVLVEEISYTRVHLLHFTIVCGAFFFYLVPNLLWNDSAIVLDPLVAEAITRLITTGWNVFHFSIFALAFATYFRVYRQTMERPAFILMVGFVFGLASYSSYLIQHLFFRDLNSPVLDLVFYYLGFLGTVLLVSTYLLYPDYAYRLPDNYYIIMLAYKSGLPIQIINLKSKKRVEITEELLSGFLSAVNNMFRETLRSSTDIEIMASKDATIVMESTENVVGIVIGEKCTVILRRALRMFLRKFEAKFTALLTPPCHDMSKFDSTRDLIPMVFPFFQIEDLVDHQPHDQLTT